MARKSIVSDWLRTGARGGGREAMGRGKGEVERVMGEGEDWKG
jgi:hypothetical protein